MSEFHNDAIFWVEVEKIKPNPYQPRREFDQDRLNDLAESIRQYGVLQPLVVTRNEIVRDDGGISVDYELIAGERRHRASQIAGLSLVPVIIRSGHQDARVKLELAIIENLQREDLNPVDRGRAFKQLSDEFNFKHVEIAKKVGKSREYVSNTIRLLTLPEEIQNAIVAGQIREGHARPILMLTDRPEQQMTLFKEMLYKKLTVREAEHIARRIAYDKVRKKERTVDPAIIEMEEKLAESLGTRVHIEKNEIGGRIVIDFFSPSDLETILNIVNSEQKKDPEEMLNNHIDNSGIDKSKLTAAYMRPKLFFLSEQRTDMDALDAMSEPPIKTEEKNDPDEDLYSISSFSL
ncbi:hypothetical protein COW81_02500 [Candidatus Campbellbacteria bacterium CG22_combo_CG10-13_8_21_14_all_36_13]|uniref:ParB-like N-terminal domain-containing protein n=1 Tax=Candidatus Campbellbacteria bacterium CG22_combo_CG10-13_8_21_14_all_36_13 TaxID=1974529 RepID=A0A2H0DXY9_9BACT|nr:MAG: hypothetical protein COW81_02500 [Candidatus Campbellbacteria bacterium CG22_combo_CG10-13_8_21_14_all_36_13]